MASSFSLPELSFDYTALEPYIDSATMHLHHQKHHQTYISKLNEALQGAGAASDDDLIALQRGAMGAPAAVRNNGGGHYNHSLFWKWMAPVGASNAAPFGALQEAIEVQWGSLQAMKDAFTAAALTRFGSGWAWLGVKGDGTLAIASTANQDNPLMAGYGGEEMVPILGLDVWEHAYYLKYNNRRPEYVSQWWSVVNWDKVVLGYEEYAAKGRAVPVSI